MSSFRINVQTGLVAVAALLLALVAFSPLAGAQAGYPPVAPDLQILPAGGAELFDIENYADTVTENGVDVDGDLSDASADVRFGGGQPVSTAGSGGAVALAHTGSSSASLALLGLAMFGAGGAAVIRSRRV